jgi:hypothetical protein
MMLGGAFLTMAVALVFDGLGAWAQHAARRHARA